MKIIQQLKGWQVILIFCIIAVLIRFPFFFRDYVDYDESTFILMGQSLINGHLPYIKYWDLKPPLVFYFFAGVISVFGKSFIAIRLIGSLVVAGTAWFTYKLSNLYFNKIISFFSGLLTVYFLSLFGAMQGVMSEHLAALPLVTGMYFLSKHKSNINLLVAGFLFGLAIMCRLNLAYALFFIYAYITLERQINLTTGIKNGFLLTISAVSAFLLCFFPYILNENIDILKTSVIEASLAYSNVSWSNMFKTIPMLLIFIGVVLLSLKFLKPKLSRHNFFIINIMILGQCVMFFKSGKINGHYLIQIFPFASILLVGLISKIPIREKTLTYIPRVLFILFLLIPVESYLEYANIFKSKSETGIFYNGEGNTIPYYLKKNYSEKEYKNIFFLNEHIGYWNLNTMPPTPISIHPSNIFRETAYPFVDARESPLKELDFILNEIKPNFIVFDKRRIPISNTSDEYKLLNEKLNSYTLEKEFGKENQVKLYKKN